VKIFEKQFIQYVFRFFSVKPNLGFNDIVLLPSIKLTASCYMRKKQTCSFIGAKGRCSSILEKVQSVLGVKATSLGSLSEASLVVTIETLKVKNRSIDTLGDFFTICRGP